MSILHAGLQLVLILVAVETCRRRRLYKTSNLADDIKNKEPEILFMFLKLLLIRKERTRKLNVEKTMGAMAPPKIPRQP